MQLHLDPTSAVQSSDHSVYNGVKPAVLSSWARIEKDTVKLFKETWCRDILMYHLLLAGKEVKNEHYPQTAVDPFITYGYKNLLYVVKKMSMKPDYKLCEAEFSHIHRGLKLVNFLEKQLGKIFQKPLLRTRLLETDNPDYLVFAGSRFWKQTTLHASLWTMILRTSLFQDKTPQIDLGWVFNFFPKSSYTIPLGHWDNHGNYQTILAWHDLVPYIPIVLGKLPVDKINSGKVPPEHASPSSGILAGFSLMPGNNLYYTAKIKEMLFAEMQSAGDPNAQKVPK